MTFPDVNTLRLEVEDEPVGLVNLVSNPNGELGGYGWVTPVAGSNLVGGQAVTYTSPGGVASYFRSELLPVTGGEFLAASWLAPDVDGYYRARVEWLTVDGAAVSSSLQSSFLTSSADRASAGPFLVPATAAFARLRFDHYSTVGGAHPTAGQQVSLVSVTASPAATAAELGTTRTNLVRNPNFAVNVDGWEPAGPIDMYRVLTLAYAPPGTMQIESMSRGTGRVSQTAAHQSPVVGGATYALQLRIRTRVVPPEPVAVQIAIRWYDAQGRSPVATFSDRLPVTNVSARPQLLATAPSYATHARVFLLVDAVVGANYVVDTVILERSTEFGTYFDGDTPSTEARTNGWTGAPHASTSQQSYAQLDYISPIPFVNVMGPTVDLSIVREDLQLGTLTATIVDALLDPAKGDLIRPGKRVRLLVDVDQWQPVFTGRVLNGATKYDMRTPNRLKRARVTLTAVDSVNVLANVARAEGVATIDELPYVLEGAGVPWNVNGSGDQVPTATVVARNDNASAVDQVAVTRDSARGYAWVNRHGVLCAFDQDQIPAAAALVLDESVYSDVDVDFNIETCVNEVRLKVLRLSPATGDTEEVSYGPYRDLDSIREWGTRSAEFTVQGVEETPAALEGYAAAILAANGTPQVRVNSATIPVRRPGPVCLVDLYDMAAVASVEAGLDEEDRVTGIEHVIRGGRWRTVLTFAVDGSAAPPHSIPAPGNPEGMTLAELLCPVGTVRLFYGSLTQVPGGWLFCNGTAFDPDAYPKLHAHLSQIPGHGDPTVLPNMVDRFPIGAGVKSIGSVGGSPSRVLTPANIPHTAADNTTATGTATRLVSIGGPAADPVDILNPWFAVRFIIRAV